MIKLIKKSHGPYSVFSCAVKLAFRSGVGVMVKLEYITIWIADVMHINPKASMAPYRVFVTPHRQISSHEATARHFITPHRQVISH
jgi:hypothetical protein